jgi:death-on-curing protein
MIQIEFVINVHEILIEKFGGIHGIRDKKRLESAISRPFMTFDQQDLYPSPIEKAAALLESVISNHPFLDGNKRIGYVLMQYFLMENNLEVSATQTEKYEFIIRIAQGQLDYVQIRLWLSERVIKR